MKKETIVVTSRCMYLVPGLSIQRERITVLPIGFGVCHNVWQAPSFDDGNELFATQKGMVWFTLLVRPDNMVEIMAIMGEVRQDGRLLLATGLTGQDKRGSQVDMYLDITEHPVIWLVTVSKPEDLTDPARRSPMTNITRILDAYDGARQGWSLAAAAPGMSAVGIKARIPEPPPPVDLDFGSKP